MSHHWYGIVLIQTHSWTGPAGSETARVNSSPLPSRPHLFFPPDARSPSSALPAVFQSLAHMQRSGGKIRPCYSDSITVVLCVDQTWIKLKQLVKIFFPKFRWMLSRSAQTTLCWRLQLTSSECLIFSSSCLHRSFWLDNLCFSLSLFCLASASCLTVEGDSTSTVWVTYWKGKKKEIITRI